MESKETKEFWEMCLDPAIEPRKLKLFCGMQEAVSSAKRAGKTSAKVNFSVVEIFLGDEAAKKLMTRRGTLYIPPGRSRAICEKVGEQAGRILTSKAFRFVFESYEYGKGSALILPYSGRFALSKKEALPVWLAAYDFSSSCALEGTRLFPTQVELSTLFGVSQPDISKARNTDEYAFFFERLARLGSIAKLADVGARWQKEAAGGGGDFLWEYFFLKYIERSKKYFVHRLFPDYG